MFYYFVKNWKPSKTKKKRANFFCKSVVCVFLLHLFQKNFSPKLGQKLLRRKMVLKKFTFYFFLQSRYSLLDWICFLNFFSLICLFFTVFCRMPNPKIDQWLKSKTTNQMMRLKNKEQQTVGTQTFPHLNSLTFNYMWINFQVFVSHASSCLSFYYSPFCYLLSPTLLSANSKSD